MKKYLFFIVEGKNDKIEMQAIIRSSLGSVFLDNYVDSYHVHNGDITTEKDTSDKTIVVKLEKIIVSWRNGKEEPFQKIRPSDVEGIIHVIDTDGVFVPENQIVETEDAKVIYRENEIAFFDRQQIVGRNRKKAKVIKRLLGVNCIDNIPYKLLFASCNMDHLLFDERNSDKKSKNAFCFARECKERQYLNNSIFAEGIRADGPLDESWEIIQRDNNSLQRHTNINIMLDNIKEWFK